MTAAPERVCTNCGVPYSDSASFCSSCDTFLGWHDDVDPAPVVAAEETASGAAGAGADTVIDEAAPPPPPRPDPVRPPPAVSTESSEVVVAADAPGTFQMVVRNTSTIVDSYLIEVADPPSWLTLTHTDTNLLPDETRPVQVTLAVRPRELAVAQRIQVTLRVRSTVDTTRSADVPMSVVVPPSGPPAALEARPTLVRLENRAQGAFLLRLDNRAANHPRRYTMAASDPEGVVMLDFVPPAVVVPAGETSDVMVRFAAPEPPPGKELTRQLTVTATDDDGAVAVQVTIAQVTSPELERQPLKLRLEPSEVTTVDATTARLDLVVDNRGGHEDVVVSLRGQDPAKAVSFAFDHNGFPLSAGRAVRLGMGVAAALPPPGQSVTRPFTVVAAAGDLETDIKGTFELTSRPAAIATAHVRLVPDHLVVSSRRGNFAVEIDNRQGALPLEVGLFGSDEFGTAGFRFSPAQLAVPPGQVGRASMVVEHPKPSGGTSASRRVRVSAKAGAGAVDGEAVFTQKANSYRRWWAILAVLTGVLLVVLGVLRYADDLPTSDVEDAVRALVDDAQSKSTPDDGQVGLVGAVAALGVVLLCAVMMLFGLIGTTGKSIRVASVLAALAAVGAMVASPVRTGFALILVGAVLAFVGGILLRRTG
jgi:hypothetical protein